MNQQENPPDDTWKALKLDIDYYQSLLDDEDIPDDQKRAFIETLWSIMVSFVDLGFRLHPLSQSCGQNTDEELTASLTDMLSLPNHSEDKQKTGGIKAAQDKEAGYNIDN